MDRILGHYGSQLEQGGSLCDILCMASLLKAVATLPPAEPSNSSEHTNLLVRPHRQSYYKAMSAEEGISILFICIRYG